jgi:hypothetical protein
MAYFCGFTTGEAMPQPRANLRTIAANFLTLKSVRYVLCQLAIGLCLFSIHRNARAAEPIKIAMTPDHWKTTGSAEFVKHNGIDSLALKPGDNTATAALNDLVFRNGTIEFDVDQPGSMGTGIVFRREKDSFANFEYFYLRAQPKCSEAFDCIQYTTQAHWSLLWDLFPQYQSPAPVQQDGWNHVKLVVSGKRMNVFINGTQSPTLKVGKLAGDTSEGNLLLVGPGFFANLTIVPDAVEGLPAEPEKDPTADDLRYLRNWQIAPFYTLPAGKEPTAADLPSSSATWTGLAAERFGLMNISRLYGRPLEGKGPDRPVAWLKTTITSGKNQTKKVSIGWVREVWVFVNGKQVYADKNFYQPPAARKKPDGRCSLENGSFELPLNAGANEVDVALASNFDGWGFVVRLDDADGVHLTRK